jgi:hypothetical protein
MTALQGWENFYVIVGSAAGALIGLQFVVVTLIAERPPLRAAEGGAAFATPTIVHFSIVLLLSALTTIPWHEIRSVSFVWSIVGFVGVLYSILVTHRLRMQKIYIPVFEDWLFHVLLPLGSYMMLFGSFFVARSHEPTAMFTVGGATLLLLLAGVHNAWDAVTYHVLVNRGEQRTTGQKR